MLDTGELPSPHGSVRGWTTYSTPTVQGNGGTPIFALKWACRTDYIVEYDYCSYRQTGKTQVNTISSAILNNILLYL